MTDTIVGFVYNRIEFRKKKFNVQNEDKSTSIGSTKGKLWIDLWSKQKTFAY